MNKYIRNSKFLYISILIEITTLTILIFLSVYLLIIQYNAQERLKAAARLRYTSYLLSDQLRQSSDDLTRMVRSYAATGDMKFRNYFWQILAIRNGKKPRPNNYERIYWDFMMVEAPEPPFKNGAAISLNKLMKDSGFTKTEFKLLAIAQENSDRLVSLEETAMHAMQGQFQDTEGNYSVTGTPDPSLALNILFGEDYHQAKKNIMTPINEFIATIDKRTSQKVILAESQIYLYNLILRLVWGGLIFNVIILFLTVFRYQNLSTKKLKQANKEIASEKERLSVTLHCIGDGVITTDIEGNIVLINKITEELTGWTQQEAFGRPIYEVFNIINEETGEPCQNPVDKVLASGIIVGLANHTALISRNGIKYTIEDSGAPIFDHEKNIIGTVLVFRDATDDKRIAQELIKIKKLEAIGTLAGGIAHDFNNIMMGIFGNISLAKIKLPKDHPILHYLEESEQSMSRAKQLTGQLLTFSSGGSPIKSDISISQLIEKVVTFDLSGSNVKLVFEYSKDLWTANVDEGQIQQVFSNLAINARQAMPEGGVFYIRLNNADITDNTVQGLIQGKYIKATVQDEGAGIKHKHLDRIFEPFFTTKELGRGLGLATTYSVIKRHGGVLSVVSELGTGTIFTLYLPASETQPACSKTKQTEVAEDSTIEQTARILVMDDDEKICNYLKNILEEYGFLVSTAVDGKQAIDMYKQLLDDREPFGAVVLDLTILGGIGGKEVIKDILKINPKAKCIISSGYADDPVMANYIEYGFKANLTKPYTSKQLLEVLNQVLKE